MTLGSTIYLILTIILIYTQFKGISTYIKVYFYILIYIYIYRNHCNHLHMKKSMFHPISPENWLGLVADLEADPFVEEALSAASCEIYDRYGMVAYRCIDHC